jgi:hypothetical protein
MIIELSEDETDILTLALGFATGAAFKDGNRRMAYAFLALANTVHKNNPHYVPYEIPPDMRPEALHDA